MRVQARRALPVDSAIGLVLAVTSWMASYYVWDRSAYNRRGWGGHDGTGPVVRLFAAHDQPV